MFVCLRSFCLILLCTNAVYLVEDTDDEHWQCDNGELIDFTYKCDRTFHCKDYSDETFWNCLPKEFNHDLAYCTYGALLERSMICNNITDCLDGSDELPARCIDTYLDELQTTWQGTCRLHAMECKPGECIDNELVCDGHRDCSNGQDETLAHCGYQVCGELSFRCGYGACIDSHKVCDQTADCADGSDETLDWPKCNRNETLLLLRPQMNVHVEKKPNHCHIPPHNRLLVDVFNGFEAIVERNISYVPVDTIVLLSCAPGYKLIGKNESACGLHETWMVALPKCEKYCDLKEDLSLRMDCRTAAGLSVACSSQVLPGTVVSIDCACNYQRPVDGSFQARLTCLENGQFNAKLQPCKPGCGVSLNPPILADGVSQTPWLVALYSKTHEHNEESVQFRCIGTLIDPYWILTAAHCAENVTLVYAIANKQYQDFYTLNEHDNANPAKDMRIIAETIPHSDYAGEKFNYSYDVALVRVVEPYIYSMAVWPLCTISKFDATAPTSAKFSAWGLNNRISTNLANILDFTADSSEFKLQLLDGAESTHGDSGSGVYFETDNVRYLQGVLSKGSAEVVANVTVTNLNHKKVLDFLRIYLPGF